MGGTRPEHPDRFFVFPPKGLTPDSERFGFTVVASNNGTEVGQLSIYPTVHSEESARPVLKEPYEDWKPKFGDDFSRRYLSFYDFGVLPGRRITHLNVTNYPLEEGQSDTWIRREHHYSSSVKLDGGSSKPGQSKAVVEVTAYDDKGSSSVIARFNALPKKEKESYTALIAFASVFGGLCVLDCGGALFSSWRDGRGNHYRELLVNDDRSGET